MLGACAIVNLNCLRLMNEHTAAALSYGIYKSARNLFHEKDPECTMLLNLDHSTLQVSIVSHIQGNLRVQAATFGRNLGSRDSDLALANKFDERVHQPLHRPSRRVRRPSRRVTTTLGDDLRDEPTCFEPGNHRRRRLRRRLRWRQWRRLLRPLAVAGATGDGDGETRRGLWLRRARRAAAAARPAAAYDCGGRDRRRRQRDPQRPPTAGAAPGRRR